MSSYQSISCKLRMLKTFCIIYTERSFSHTSTKFRFEGTIFFHLQSFTPPIKKFINLCQICYSLSQTICAPHEFLSSFFFITMHVASDVYNAQVTEKGRLAINHSLLPSKYLNRRPRNSYKTAVKFHHWRLLCLIRPSLCFWLKKH